MKNFTKKYLFTPAVDIPDKKEQFQFGFSNIDGVNLSFFDKIFFYNVKGIKVYNNYIKRKNIPKTFSDLALDMIKAGNRIT